MDKIKKRLLDGVKNLQLVKNEMDRLEILGKPVTLDGDAVGILELVARLTGEIKSLSDQAGQP